MTLQNIQHQLKDELAELNRLISQSLLSNNELMNRVIEGYLKKKGKQIRPILVILSAKLFGGMNERVVSAAAAVEMLHNASLIHDDVVDESKLRHSRPTINSVWDNHIAVLVGDFFVSSSLARALETEDLRIVHSIAQLGRLLSLGEIDQIYNARYHKLTEEAYFQIISRKTAALFVACVEMGGYAVNADPSQLDLLRRFAEYFGLCFQIRDDIFDYFDEGQIGKPTGNDLREGKITLPLLYALSREDLAEHDEMNRLSRKEELSAEDIDRLIAFARSAGGIEFAYSRMEQLREKAAEALRFIDGPEEIKETFLALIDFVISRKA